MKQHFIVLVAILNTVTTATLSESSNVTLQKGVSPITNDTSTLNKTLQATEDPETTTLEPPATTTVTPVTLASKLEDNTEMEDNTELQDDMKPVEDRKLEGVATELLKCTEKLETTTLEPTMKTTTVTPVTSTSEVTDNTRSGDDKEAVEEVFSIFNKTNLRISEIKCNEYVLDLYNRREISRYRRQVKFRVKRRSVFGGRTVMRSEFPHMAAIGWRTKDGSWTFKCGGTLISPKFVLTAAHCNKVSKRDPDVYGTVPEIVIFRILFIHANQVKEYSDKQKRYIKKITVHPNYTPPKQYYDIAIIELEGKVEFDMYVHPACLWSSFDTSILGTKASVTGWGKTDPGPFAKPSPWLQAADVDIVDLQTCNDLLEPLCNRNQCGIKEHQICAGVLAGGVDTCQGDSGGPLQIKIPLEDLDHAEKIYFVIGVTSFGKGCARENTPAVYTRVSSFLDWIEDIVWPK